MKFEDCRSNGTLVIGRTSKMRTATGVTPICALTMSGDTKMCADSAVRSTMNKCAMKLQISTSMYAPQVNSASWIDAPSNLEIRSEPFTTQHN